jgi:hypothetical protein
VTRRRRKYIEAARACILLCCGCAQASTGLGIYRANKLSKVSNAVPTKRKEKVKKSRILIAAPAAARNEQCMAKLGTNICRHHTFGIGKQTKESNTVKARRESGLLCL